MRVGSPHSWKVTPEQALRIQEQLRAKMWHQTPSRLPRLVAGADISYSKVSTEVYAGVVVIDINSLQTVEAVRMTAKATFPYVPGLLSFREIPPLLEVFRKLRIQPEAVICDGHGMAHPRRFGLACHLGVLLDLPSLGCAKSRLIGHFQEPGPERGQLSPLRNGKDVIGSVLRTRTGIQPVFVSVGHRISLEMAQELVLLLTPHFRLPETTRRANQLVNELRHTRMKTHCASTQGSINLTPLS